MAAALSSVFGNKGGAIIIAVGLALFAFSTVLSWSLYGTRCVEFLFGSKAVKPYQVIFIIVIFVGATMDLGLAWDIADTLNGMMMIPNLIGVIALSGVVVRDQETLRRKGKQVSKKNLTSFSLRGTLCPADFLRILIFDMRASGHPVYKTYKSGVIVLRLVVKEMKKCFGEDAS